MYCQLRRCRQFRLCRPHYSLGAAVVEKSANAAMPMRVRIFMDVSYFFGFMTEQVPSERFVMTVPSGRVTLAVE